MKHRMKRGRVSSTKNKILFILMICGLIAGSYWAYNHIKPRTVITNDSDLPVLYEALTPKIQRQLIELEREIPKRGNNYQELSSLQSENKEMRYTSAMEMDEDFFRRHWENDHWIYTPTRSTSEPNLFRRIKDANGRWEFIPLIKKIVTVQKKYPLPKNEMREEAGEQLLNSKENLVSFQEKELSSEDEGLEKARKEIQDELEAIRKKRTQ